MLGRAPRIGREVPAQAFVNLFACPVELLSSGMRRRHATHSVQGMFLPLARTLKALPPIPCSNCEIPFQATSIARASRADGKAIYCSRACQKAGSAGQVLCSICGATFSRAKHRPIPINPYCSTGCRNEGNRQNRTGTTKPCDWADCEVPVYRIASVTAPVRFCSYQHHGLWLQGKERVARPERPCEQCGKLMRLEPDQVAWDQKYCGRDCRNAARRAPVGHRVVDAETGYVSVFQPDLNGVVRRQQEHRWVMEQQIGRALYPWETVHHLKGGFKGRSNNDPSNLQLWASRHPKGHRAEDIAEYCREMLSLYGDEAEQDRYAGHRDRLDAGGGAGGHPMT